MIEQFHILVGLSIFIFQCCLYDFCSMNHLLQKIHDMALARLIALEIYLICAKY